MAREASKLTEVVTDITGVTGMSIIEAILEGNATPLNWPNCEIIAVFPAKRNCPRVGRNVAARTSLRASAGARLVSLPSPADHRVRPAGSSRAGKVREPGGEKTRTGKPRKSGRKSNDVRFEATGPLFKALGVDLTLIEGIEVRTALVIMAEIGVDVSRFPTEKHFASWLGVPPTG